MSLFALILASPLALGAARPAPPCRMAQLRLSLDGRHGDFNGMSHSGTEISIRNMGPDCMLPALPRIEFRDARGRTLPVERKASRGIDRGPVIAAVRVHGRHRAATALRWVSGPVYPRSRAVRTATVTVRLGTAALRAPLVAVLYGPAGKPITFDQAPLRAMEGVAGG